MRLSAEVPPNLKSIRPLTRPASGAERQHGSPLKRGESFTTGDYQVTAVDVSAERARRIKVERLPAA